MVAKHFVFCRPPGKNEQSQTTQKNKTHAKNSEDKQMDVFGGAHFHPSEVLRRSACPLPCPPGTRWLRQEEGKGLGWGGTHGNPTCHMYLPPNFWFGLVIWWFDLVVSPLLPARNRGSNPQTTNPNHQTRGLRNL